MVATPGSRAGAGMPGEALFVIARLARALQPLLYGSLSAVQSEYRQYRARAMEEKIVRHTGNGAQNTFASHALFIPL